MTTRTQNEQPATNNQQPTTINEQQIQFFRTNLFAWAAANPRPMPWKGEKDPYKIWLSEIILQQTRVEQGWPYFEKFAAKYPNVRALANAPEDEVLKLWEGLGYYTRARNLHAAAKYIAGHCNGVFPDTYEAIRALKGVGDYTAAAIAAFAFNLPHAVLDGNVYRVLSRFFAIETPTDLPVAKKQFTLLANTLLDPERPGAFNQAMMDFGATGCTPAQPVCPTCLLRTQCAAALQNRVAEFPVRAKKMAKKERFFLYLIIRQGEQVFLRKRTGNDIWRGLHEFPMLEVENPADLNRHAVEAHFFKNEIPPEWVWGGASEHFHQILTHRQVTAIFIEVHLPTETSPDFFQHPVFHEGFKVPYSDVKKKIAFPRVIVRFLEKNI